MNGQDEMENDIIVQIGISPIVKGIKAVKDGSKIKITADSNVDAGNKITIKARYGDSTNQTCDVVITKDIQLEEIPEPIICWILCWYRWRRSTRWNNICRYAFWKRS